MSAAKKTTDHETIRKWIEERGGKPSHVRETANGDMGILRIDFPDYLDGDSLEPISWEQFFAKFEDSKLALLYQDRTDDGETSFFNKLVSRDE